MITRTIHRAATPLAALALLGTLGSGARAVEVDLVEVASGLSSPVDVTGADDDSGRLFIVEQAGVIRIHDGAGLLPTPFLDIGSPGGPVIDGGERGLLGLAFHPRYETNGWFYVNYTGSGGQTRISRFSVDPTDPNRADPGSEVVLLRIDQPYSNHNGGDLAFGPDGFLYVPTGDGGSGGDPQDRSQNPQTLLGKMLRIDVDVAGPALYAIPDDNPFVGDPTTLDEIWALGLRNPWRVGFDRLTGDLWIADVGQNDIEEINFQAADSTGGENYGWRCYEGSMVFNDTDCGPASEYDFPVFEYTHAEGRSVTGGFVYRGARNPDLQGHYFFADFIFRNAWTTVANGVGGWTTAPTEPLGLGIGSISTFGEDDAGELYVASFNGRVYRIDGACPGFALSATQTDESAPGAADGSVDLTIGNGTAPFDIAWSNGATTEDLLALTAGTYQVDVTDAAGCTLTETVVLNECEAPTGLTQVGQTADAVQLTWSHENAPAYLVYHDCLSCQGTGPAIAPTPINFATLTGLESCSVYASVVLAICPDQQVRVSTPQPFFTGGCP